MMDIGVALFGQIGPANQMIALIQKITREADFAALSVGPRAEQLLALLREQGLRLVMGKTAANPSVERFWPSEDMNCPGIQQ